MRALFFAIILGSTLSGASNTQAQTAADENEGLTLTQDASTGTCNLSWWGNNGWTYFIQTSDDLEHWTYLPVIDSGAGAIIAYDFTSTASRFFFRIRCTDAPAGVDPDGADFDGDHVPNSVERTQGTDPLGWTDADQDSIPDDWEIMVGLDPGNADDALLDPDSDGLTNAQEFANNSKPTVIDTDGDGVSDAVEAQLGSNPNTPAGLVHPVSLLYLGYYPGSSFLSWTIQADQPYPVQLWLRGHNPSDALHVPPTVLAPPDGTPVPNSGGNFWVGLGYDVSTDLSFFPLTAQVTYPNAITGKTEVVNVRFAGIACKSDIDGVIGGFVQSAKAGSTIKHFVTPQANTDLPQPHVVLLPLGFVVDPRNNGDPGTAHWDLGVAPAVSMAPPRNNGDPGTAHWDTDGGEADTNDPQEVAPQGWRISRSDPGLTKIKLVTNNGKLIDETWVWVVWCEKTAAMHVGSDPPDTVTRIGVTWARPAGEKFTFEFKILPEAIIANANALQEAPDLLGPADTFPSGVYGRGVKGHWDVSRKLDSTYTDSAPTTLLYPQVDFGSGEGADKALQSPFPIASLRLDTSPDGAIGNDDQSVTDEANDPYVATDKGSFGSLEVQPPVGRLASLDIPRMITVEREKGQPNEETSVTANFQEFVRLEINRKWYVISNMVTWYTTPKLKNTNGIMSDSGTTAGLGTSP